MKKRLLALLLVIAMLVSAAPAAFALELPDVGNIDTTKVQAAIATLNVYVTEKMEEAYGPSSDVNFGEYEVTSDSYYVSLGDSSVTGAFAKYMDHPEGYGNIGYKSVVPASFPYKLAKKLGLNIETQYIQLALASMRTNDLRYVLDESFAPDGYTLDFVMDNINSNAGGLDAMRADLKAALAKADLVTLGIGGNNMTNFLGDQIKGKLAAFLKSNDELMNILNGMLGAQIKPIVDEYFNLESPYYEMNWNAYLDAEGMQYVKAVLTEVKTMLAEAGIPEVYSFDLGEVIQPMIDEQFGGADVFKVSIPMDIPMHQLAADIVEICLYGCITHVTSYAAVVDMIHELSDAKVVLLGSDNPMEDMVIVYEDTKIPMGDVADRLVSLISASGIVAATRNEDTIFVPMENVESNIDYSLQQNGYVIDLKNFDLGVVGVDGHATEKGHTTIAEAIYSALNVKNTEPAVNPFKDVAEKDYFFEPVMWAVQNGITSGLSADTFGATKGCTRAQVVTFLWRAAGEPAPKSSANPFTDVKQGQYYYDAVLWAVENGITTGLSATTFGPNENCNRGQIVTFLWRAMGKPAPTNSTNPFKDVSAKQYYYDAVLWAVENGITTGLNATSFGPNSTCTRGQIVTFLYRAYK